MSEERRKVYVEVLATHMIDGECVPVSISFENGVEYRIDRVRAWERISASMPSVRYTIIVGGKQTYLYLEDNGKWYVRAKSIA